MKAKKKELRRDSLDTYAVKPRLKLLGAEVQILQRLRVIIDGKDPDAAAAELVSKLRNEARVIA